MGLLQARRLPPRQSPAVAATATPTVARRSRSQATSVIDLSDDENAQYEVPLVHIGEEEDNDGIEEDDFVRELTPSEISDLEARLAKLSTSSIPQGYEHIEPTLTSSEIFVHEELDVELTTGEFMRIKNVLRHLLTGDVLVQGILFRRTRKVNGYFKRNRNELCAIVQGDADSANPALHSNLALRPLESVLQVRNIVITNAEFPVYSFRRNGRFYGTSREQLRLIEETEILACRWKFVEYISLKDGRVVSGAVVQVSETEADAGKSVSDVLRKRSWLNKKNHKSPKEETGTKKRESSVDIDAFRSSSENDREVIDLTTSDSDSSPAKRPKHSSHASFRQSSTTSTTPRRTYRYGDICAGAGGMARGAHAAGLRVRWLLDHWEEACNTLELNWPGKSLYQSIFDFCTEKENFWGRLVDVLHVSFPCQTYAACHTVPGKNDDANNSAGYSVIPLLERTRPRVVTFEQTATLLTRHRESFSALVHQLTTMNYNVRWRIFVCSEHGNVQPRKRLFMIASCPGEPLPPFPKPTHGPTRANELVTIKDRLSFLPPDRQIPFYMQRSTPKDRQPYNSNIVLRSCITCDGGKDDLHPRGDRSFNMQELALLAGFPPEHKFAETGMTKMRKQIGNAVPSMVAEQIFKEVIKSMQAADQVEAEYKPLSISIDDD